MILLLLGCGPEPSAVATGIASPNPVVRQDMVDYAKNLDADPELVAALEMAAISDPAATVRAAAIEALAEMGSAESAPKLYGAINDVDPRVQRAAIEAVARLGDKGAVPVLIEYLAAREQEKPPVDAIWALGVLEDGRATPILSRLATHPDPYVAFNATVALREIGDAPAGGDAIPADGAAPVEGAVPTEAPAAAENAEGGVKEAPAEELPPPIEAAWPPAGN